MEEEEEEQEEEEQGEEEEYEDQEPWEYDTEEEEEDDDEDLEELAMEARKKWQRLANALDDFRGPKSKVDALMKEASVALGVAIAAAAKLPYLDRDGYKVQQWLMGGKPGLRKDHPFYTHNFQLAVSTPFRTSK